MKTKDHTETMIEKNDFFFNFGMRMSIKFIVLLFIYFYFNSEEGSLFHEIRILVLNYIYLSQYDIQT